MAFLSPISGPKRVITVTDHGNILEFGDVSGAGTGVWFLQFEPDSLFEAAGGIVVMGRSRLKAASDDKIGFHPIPYRQVFLNGVAGDYSFASAPISSSSMIHIPATGMAVAVLVSCLAGTATLYLTPHAGSVAV